MNPLRDSVDFLKDLKPRLPGVADDILVHEMVATLNEMCVEGWAWPLYTNILDIKEGERAIQLNPMPNNTKIAFVYVAEYLSPNGWSRKLGQLTGRNYRWEDTSDDPTSFLVEEPGSILLWPIPTRDIDKALQLKVLLTPLDDCPDTPLVPDYFFTHHRDMLIAGVCARMSTMPNMQFTSNTFHTRNSMKFRSKIVASRNYTRQQFQFGGATWSYPEFASAHPFNTAWPDFRGRGI